MDDEERIIREIVGNRRKEEKMRWTSIAERICER